MTPKVVRQIGMISVAFLLSFLMIGAGSGLITYYWPKIEHHYWPIIEEFKITRRNQMVSYTEIYGWIQKGNREECEFIGQAFYLGSYDERNSVAMTFERLNHVDDQGIPGNKLKTRPPGRTDFGPWMVFRPRGRGILAPDIMLRTQHSCGGTGDMQDGEPNPGSSPYFTMIWVAQAAEFFKEPLYDKQDPNDWGGP